MIHSRGKEACRITEVLVNRCLEDSSPVSHLEQDCPQHLIKLVMSSFSLALKTSKIKMR